MAFLESKYAWLFKFFDQTGNGSLSLSDFTAKALRATEQVKEFFLAQENGEELIAKNLETIKNKQIKAYQNIFEQLVKQIDKNNDAHIDKDEWATFCRGISSYVKSHGSLPNWFRTLLEEYFTTVLDFDSNGAIDFYEMAFMGDAPVEVAWYCFDFLTKQGTEPLDKESFLKFTADYLTCNDPSDRSRYMFGFIQA